jgi:hypothetical protein
MLSEVFHELSVPHTGVLSEVFHELRTPVYGMQREAEYPPLQKD